MKQMMIKLDEQTIRAIIADNFWRIIQDFFIDVTVGILLAGVLVGLITITERIYLAIFLVGISNGLVTLLVKFAFWLAERLPTPGEKNVS